MNNILAGIISLLVVSTPVDTAKLTSPLSEVNYSLTNRYGNTFVNDVFADNILLTLAYLRGEVTGKNDLSWDQMRAPFNYSFTLHPGETFAFHDNVLPEYKGKIKLTTNAHFGSDEGFKSDGYLVGDGVCHLASFIAVAAREAGLTVVAPTRHDFAKIEDVSREDGVSINSVNNGQNQNLYITNNLDQDVTFTFNYHDRDLHIAVAQIVVN